MIVRVMGIDHQPRSSNFSELPDEVALAALSGLGLFLPEFNVHEFDWSEKQNVQYTY